MISPPPTSDHRIAAVRRGLDVALIVVAILYLISIPDQSVHIDEPWFGELAYRVAHEGVARSALFTGLAHYEDRVLMAHKLFIYLGALTIVIFGWHVWSLRILSIVAGAVLVWVLICHLRSRATEQSGLTWRLGCLFLLLTPLDFRYINLYRPEILQAACGFASYHWLTRFLATDRRRDLVLGAVFAGISPLVHLNGLLFIGAGIVLLWFWGKRRSLLVFVPLSLALAALYFWDIVGHWTLLQLQLHENPALHPSATAWYGPFARLIDEHKRLFRKTDVIFSTLLFLGALAFHLKTQRPRLSPLVIYTLAVVAGLGMVAQRKTISYTVTLYPFFAVVIAQATSAWLSTRVNRWPRYAALGLVLWGAFLMHSLYADVILATTGKQDVAEDNRRLATMIPSGSVVSAPLDFVFEEIDNFDVRGQEAVRMLLARTNKVSGDLHKFYHALHYLECADTAGIPSVILDPDDIQDAGWVLPAVGARLLDYEVVYVDPRTQRVVARKPSAAP